MTSLLTSLSRSPVAAQPLILTTFSDLSPALPNGNPTADRATLVWIGRLTKPLRVVDFSISVTTAAGTFDCGLFTLSGKSGTPTATKLCSSGSTAMAGSAAALQTVTPSATTWAAANTDLWAGISCSDAGAAIGRSAPLAATDMLDARVGFAASQTPLGTGFTLTLGTTFCPWIAVRFAET